jgi:hypothetical protein
MMQPGQKQLMFVAEMCNHLMFTTTCVKLEVCEPGQRPSDGVFHSKTAALAKKLTERWGDADPGSKDGPPLTWQHLRETLIDCMRQCLADLGETP